MEQARKDAAAFLAALPDDIPQPLMGEADGEVLIEWMLPGKRAFVSFDGDGEYGYAMQVGDLNCRPGAHDGRIGEPVPADLLVHLRD